MYKQACLTEMSDRLLFMCSSDAGVYNQNDYQYPACMRMAHNRSNRQSAS